MEEIKLSDRQIINFLKKINFSGNILAGPLVNAELESGKALDVIFKKRNECFGFYIKAKKMDDGSYNIDFGCVAGPLTGDGGVWHVKFDSNDNVIECLIVSELIF